MVRHPEFPIDAWEKAPTYFGPGIKELQDQGDVAILDFDRLGMIAESQMQNDAFINSSGGNSSIAPVKIGKIPAAFVLIESLTDNDSDIHRPPQPEIFVVIAGKIKLFKARFTSNFERKNYEGPKVLSEGETIILRPAETRLKAIGLEPKASSLALAFPYIRDESEFKIIQDIVDNAPKEFPPGFTNLS